MRFFTSDLHLGHLRINELADRPFSSVEEMNETIIERWNKTVAPTDQTFVLGDVALGKLAESLPLVDRLNGRKVLIPGNHDRVSSVNKTDYVGRFWPVYAQYFVIFPEQIKVLLTRSGEVVRLCHFPPRGDSQENDRHVDKRPPDDGVPLLHGHTHSSEKISGPLSFHVGVDAHDFTPVSEEEIEEWVASL
jgi:calcineurin-like phosphoesterase family protein